ncbi:MAG: prolipoprotein diacylglyceryl transferase family protein [Acidobacteriota bacterium]
MTPWAGLVLAGIALGLTVFAQTSRDHLPSLLQRLELGLGAVFFGLLGARLGVLLHPGAGLHSAGSILLGLPAGAAWIAWRSWSLGLTARTGLDLVAPAFLLSHAIGRLGCLQAGCCGGALSRPQLHEVVSDLLLVVGISRFTSAGSPPGRRAGVALLGFSLFRLIHERFRSDLPPALVLGMTWRDLACLVGVVVAVGLLHHRGEVDQ